MLFPGFPGVATHERGYNEVCPRSGGWVDRPAGGLAEFQSIQWPLPEAVRVTFVSGGDELIYGVLS